MTSGAVYEVEVAVLVDKSGVPLGNQPRAKTAAVAAC
jgi:hypothetical protein